MEIYFDGGCSPNPGKMSACIVICPKEGKSQVLSIENLGHGTNNVAEWSACLWAVNWLRDNGITHCKILGDSMLVINQASGKWKINNQLLSEIHEEFKQLSNGLVLEFAHVRRDFNLAGIYLEQNSL